MSLTPREREVMSWIAQGKSDWQIGQILRISAKTVNYHAENVKRKLGVATRIQAVLVAIRSGALEDGGAGSVAVAPDHSRFSMSPAGESPLESWPMAPGQPPLLA